MIAESLALIAAGIGGFFGLLGLINPEWSRNVVRLRPQTEKLGGYAEFRASFGGLFLFLHGAVIAAYIAGNGFMGAAFAAALAWLGMALGRIVSVTLDAERQTRTPYNIFGAIFEIAIGLMLFAPFLAHLRP